MVEELEFIYHRVPGKSHESMFKTDKYMSNRPFEYAYIDLWIPTQAQAHGGWSYFLIIRNDISQ